MSRTEAERKLLWTIKLFFVNLTVFPIAKSSGEIDDYLMLPKILGTII